MKTTFLRIALAAAAIFAAALARPDTFTVTTIADDGPGTLREAITQANATAGPHTIRFAIGSGPRTISLDSPLPALATATLIDGRTQPGYADRPLIEIEGSALPTSAADGLRLIGNNEGVIGLAIDRFGGAAVRIVAANFCLVQHCHLGVSPDGSFPLGNAFGVVLDNAQSCEVGQNVVGDNGTGILVTAASNYASIHANTVGFGPFGDVPMGNGEGIVVEDSDSGDVANNLVGNSAACGIRIHNVEQAKVEGNTVGLATTFDPASNGLDGIRLESAVETNVDNNGVYLNWGDGIAIRGGRLVGVSNCDVLANADGVSVAEGTTGASLYHNVLSGNYVDGASVVGATTTTSDLRYNEFRGNGRYGVAAFAPDIDLWYNQLSENGADGIRIGREDPAQPFPNHVNLAQNLFRNDGDLGVRIDRGANPAAPRLLLVQATSDGSTLSILGNLVGTPGRTYYVDLYVSDDADPSGFGEGERLLGTVEATTSASGAASISTSFAANGVTRFVSGLAQTDPGGASSSDGDSSEFSNALAVGEESPLPVLTAIDPVKVQAGSPELTLDVRGDRFLTTSRVRWNGAELETIFLSKERLTAIVPADLLASAGNVAVTVLNPAPAGGASNPLAFTVENPAPTLASVTPDAALVGGAALILEVRGADFVATSRILLDGDELATTFVSSSLLRAVVPADKLNVARVANVSVRSPEPGGGTTPTLPFEVRNPAPHLDALDPATVIAGSGETLVTLKGTGFVGGSRVFWNGVERPTTVVSATTATIRLYANDVDRGGTFSAEVRNPSPGGGASNALTFTVTNPVPSISAIVPKSLYAGSSAVVVTVTGSGFVPTSTLTFDGVSQNVTFISPTELRFVASAAKLAVPGTYVAVVTNPAPGGGTSGGAALVVIGIPQIAIGPTSMLRTPSAVRANIVLRNVGTATAASLKLTKASLDGKATTTSLALSLPDLPAGGQAGVTLLFPTAVLAGPRFLSLTLTYQGGLIFATRKVAVP